MDKAPDAFRTISEVAADLDIPQHVLRFWETRFTQIKPMKRSGGRRYYRPDDVDLLRGIRRLLYGEGYTIRGVQRILKEHGIGSVQRLADATAVANFGAIEEAVGRSLSEQEEAAKQYNAAIDLASRVADREVASQACANPLCWRVHKRYGFKPRLWNLWGSFSFNPPPKTSSSATDNNASPGIG